jgi:hypothetical protein
MISEELVKEWKASNAPLRKMTTISWIMCIRDSATADDVRGQNFLSLAFLNRARKELSDLQKERKKKFTARRKKLIKMLEELHLTKAHVQYEENNPGTNECDLDSRAVTALQIYMFYHQSDTPDNEISMSFSFVAQFMVVDL